MTYGMMAEYKQVWHDVMSVVSFGQKCVSDQLCELHNSIQLSTVCFETKSESRQAHMHAFVQMFARVCSHTLTCYHHLTSVCQGPFVLSMPTYSFFKLMFSSAQWVQYCLKLRATPTGYISNRKHSHKSLESTHTNLNQKSIFFFHLNQVAYCNHNSF